MKNQNKNPNEAKHMETSTEIKKRTQIEISFHHFFLSIQMKMEKKTLASVCSVSVNGTMKWLYELNDLLTECRIFALKKSKRRNNKLLQFITLLLDQIFFREMRKRLNIFHAGFGKFLLETGNYKNFITVQDTYPKINDMDQNIWFQKTKN